MTEQIVLLPMPRSIHRDSGGFPIPADHYLRLLAPQPADLLPAAKIIQNALGRHTTHRCSIIAGGAGPRDDIFATIAIDSSAAKPQGYRLAISTTGIDIIACDPAGAFYAAQTLAQLLRQYPDALPAVHIEDRPDFPARGVMLDISRDKVPTMATLYALVDELAAMKINQLQLYTEHTFAYRAHGEVHAQASPMTGQEILELDCYCRERFIELAPNQNSFGHMERWLKLPRYKPLAEAPDGFEFPWGHFDGPFSLCPTDPRSLSLIESLYDELLPHFSSPLFNVGCDETFDVGQGRSKEECVRRGKERVYLDFLLKIYRLVRDRGRTMQFWGDIILHKPELVGELPKDMIALEWGYEANHPFDKDGAIFAAAGVPFYVCPGTSSWCTISGRTDNAIANLKNAAENGIKHGAIGYLNTDWGDWGHLQYLPVSYLGLAAGAAYGWCLPANRDLPLPEALSLHVFGDRSHTMGRLVCELGNVHHAIRKHRSNAAVLFWRLVAGPERQREWEGVTREEYDAAESAIDRAMSPLGGARMDRPDAALIADEYRNAAAMLKHACGLGRWAIDGDSEDRSVLAGDLKRIIGEHRRLWLARNRWGGLADSARRLESRLAEYER